MAGNGEPEPSMIDSTYALEDCLGRGGMGSVYRARHVHLNKAFALKLIHPKLLTSTDSLRRFEVEAKALGRLNHPSIVRVTDFGIDRSSGDTPYLVMEFLEGESLKDVLEERGALDPEEALDILEAIAEGLDYAHSQGILHRDLKPQNVILAYDKSGRRQVKIVDFGLARFTIGASERAVVGAVHSALFPLLPSDLDEDSAHTRAIEGSGSQVGLVSGTQTRTTEDGGTLTAEELLGSAGLFPSGQTQAGTLVGTAGYMAPEVADREAATPASDIYSFGVLGYEMLVGKRPFKGSFMALLRAHVFDQPPTPSTVNPALSGELDEAILAPLAKEPAGRPGSAGEVVARLREAWDRLRLARWRARERPRRLVISVAVTVGTALLGVIAGLVGPIQDLENRLVDSRFRHSAPRAPSPQLAIAVLDDASLDARPDLTLIEYNEEFARVLGPAFAAGVVGVGLDFLAPKQWGESAIFERFVLEHSDRLVLGMHSDQDDQNLVGDEFAEGLITAALGEEGAAQLFGYTNLTLDRDGAVRRVPPGWIDNRGRWQPLLSARIASIVLGSEVPDEARDDAFWVDYRIDWRQIPRWSWSELELVIEREPEALTGRFLIVGSDIEGFADSSFPLPHPAGMPEHAPGVVLQALMANTLLDSRPIRGPLRWVTPVVACLMFPFVLMTLWSERALPSLSAWLLFVIGFAAAGYVLFLWHAVMVKLAPVLVVFPLAMAAGVALRWTLPARPVRSVSGRTR